MNIELVLHAVPLGFGVTCILAGFISLWKALTALTQVGLVLAGVAFLLLGALGTWLIAVHFLDVLRILLVG